MMKYNYIAFLWDETGNILLDKQKVTVKRVHEQTAKRVVCKMFDALYDIELQSSNKL